MKRLVLTAVLMISVPTAQARELFDVLSPLTGILDQLCGFDLGDFGIAVDLSFLCTASDTLRSAETLVEGLHNDLKTFGRTTFGKLLTTGLSSLDLGFDVGAMNQVFGEIDAALLQVDNDIDNAMLTYRTVLFGAVDEAQRAAWNRFVAPSSPPGSDARDYEEMVQRTGVLQGANLVSIGREGETIKQQSELAVQQEYARKLAEETAANTAVENMVARVLTPITGTAGTLRRNAETALSTRAGLEALSQGFADYMGQSVDAAAATIDVLKTLAQQNVMTNTILSVNAQSILQEKQAEQAALRDALQTAIINKKKLGEQDIAEVTNTLRLMNDLMTTSPTALRW
jgi:uncharacterized membrane-anchored protein YhcB (DUF1043 family)